MEPVTDALGNLKLWTADLPGEDSTKAPSNNDEVVASLSQLSEALTKDGNDKKEVSESMVQNNVREVLHILLSSEEGEDKVKEKAAEIVAELAKTDPGRKHCSDCRLIISLLDLLTNENVDVSIQACRALGNICYDNDYGRSIVHEQEGGDKLITFLQSSQAMGSDREQLRTVATGFLLNLINTYDVTQERVLELDVLNILCNYLSKFGQDEDVCIHVLLVLNCLADNDNGRLKIIEKNICGVLVGLMEVEVSTEIAETILELIGNLAEDDVVKHQLASTSLCPNLIKILKSGHQPNEDETLNVTKIACDLIVLLLTGDESMEHLYGNGQGVVYQEASAWLESKDDTLQTAAALIIGNFARKDEHCTKIVSDGPTVKLIELLKKHNTKDGDIRLQHAILSALRNLAIPVQNKAALLQLGVLETVTPMVFVETFPVVFKLLGTLRMLVDGQEEAATKLGSNKDCISRIMEWCLAEDHPGVKGEANRLQAWLIKNSKSSEVMKLIVELGGLPFLVSMASSEHEVMQNEALIALSLIGASILETVEESITSSDLSSTVQKLLAGEEIQPNVKCNALTLITTLIKSDKLKEYLLKSGVPESVDKISDAENVSLSEAAKAVKQLFESV